MSRSAAPLVVLASLACSACAASGPSGSVAPPAILSSPIDADRSCMTGTWRAHAGGDAAGGDAIAVSVDNRCGRPLTCDVHLGLRTVAGPDLYLDCRDRSTPVGRTEALCRWPGQPVTPGGSGSMRCR